MLLGGEAGETLRAQQKRAHIVQRMHFRDRRTVLWSVCFLQNIKMASLGRSLSLLGRSATRIRSTGRVPLRGYDPEGPGLVRTFFLVALEDLNKNLVL